MRSNKPDLEKGSFGTSKQLPLLKDYPEVFTIGGDLIPVQDLLVLDPENLSVDYEIHAPWASVINDLCSHAKIKIEKLERKIEVQEAKAFLRLRDSLAFQGKRPSVDVIKAHVKVDEEVNDLYSKLFKLKQEYEQILALRLAMSDRKEMLISLGAEIRLGRKGS